MKYNQIITELNQTDDEIVSAIKKRISLTNSLDSDTLSQAERESLYRICSNADNDMKPYAKGLFTTIFDICRSEKNSVLENLSPTMSKFAQLSELMQKEFPMAAVVACQGVSGAYSQIAADALFSAPKIMYMKTFDSVFNAVESGLCEYGVLPIENSTAGTVSEVYDLMKKHNFYIVRSIKCHIHHRLLAKSSASMSDIKEIVSHTQAIHQCSDFLKSNPQIKVTECANTALAAQIVSESERNDIAAISSKYCADTYKLKIVSQNIQNNANNYTRFICISKKPEIYGGADKISLMLTTDNKPGALYSLLTKFATLNLNLTKLESRPIEGTDFEFMFYFDIDGSLKDNKVIELLSSLEKKMHEFTFLGSYREI